MSIINNFNNFKKLNEMYTYNNFVYGHDLSINKELNNNISEFDISFQSNINGKNYEVNSPYHGGQVNGDTMSVIFGHILTDDDDKSNYVMTVRSAKEEDYQEDYKLFLERFFINEQEGIDEMKDVTSELGRWYVEQNRTQQITEYETFINQLKDFTDNNLPTFYQVEASS